MVEHEPRLSGGVETVAGGQEGFGVLEGVRVREAAGVSDHFEVGA
jgi:hypothetical protein